MKSPRILFTVVADSRLPFESRSSRGKLDGNAPGTAQDPRCTPTPHIGSWKRFSCGAGAVGAGGPAGFTDPTASGGGASATSSSASGGSSAGSAGSEGSSGAGGGASSRGASCASAAVANSQVHIAPPGRADSPPSGTYVPRVLRGAQHLASAVPVSVSGRRTTSRTPTTAPAD